MSEFNLFKDAIPDLVLEQKKILSFLYKNLEYIHEYSEDLFFDKNLKIIFNSLKYIKENSIPLNMESVIDNISDIYMSLEQIQDALNTEYFQENIKTIKEKLETSYSQRRTISDFENIAKELLSKDFKPENIKKFADNIIENSYSLNKGDTFYSARSLMDNYKKALEDRKKNERVRTYGLKAVDRMVTRPCASGEMSLFLGLKGTAKSLFIKEIENICLNLKTCVVSINPEMTPESNSDRLMSMRTGLSLKYDILNKEINERAESRLMREIERFSNYENYLYYKRPTLTLDDLDTLLYEAKTIFKRKGILPDDEYMLVTVDLLDMIEDISNCRSPYEIKNAVNKLHRIYQKHNIHLIGLVQANENMIRNGKRFKKPEEIDSYFLQPEDIEGGAVYGQRARIIFSLNRPMILKRRFFPDREEEFEGERDIIHCCVVKENDNTDGILGKCGFVFDNTAFKIHEYREG